MGVHSIKLIDRLSSPSDQLIHHISHILPRNRHQPNQTSQVSFASEYMVLSLEILTSSKRPCPSSMVPPKYLLRSKKLYTNWLIFNNLPATHVSMHYSVVVWLSCDGHMNEFNTWSLCDMGTCLSHSDWGSGHDPGCDKGGPWGMVRHGWDQFA